MLVGQFREPRECYVAARQPRVDGRTRPQSPRPHPPPGRSQWLRVEGRGRRDHAQSQHAYRQATPIHPRPASPRRRPPAATFPAPRAGGTHQPRPRLVEPSRALRNGGRAQGPLECPPLPPWPAFPRPLPACMHACMPAEAPFCLPQPARGPGYLLPTHPPSH